MSDAKPRQDTLKVYTLEEVSQILGVSKKTIYRHIHDGKLSAKKIGRRWFITDEALRRDLNPVIFE